MAFLAMTIAQQTDYLLDEPLNNLDRHAVQIMRAAPLCDEFGRTVIRWCTTSTSPPLDHIVAMKDGGCITAAASTRW
jgi:ABC-type enterochelin transport system ATPase subunit